MNLLRYQAAHLIGNLCIGDAPARFRYRGIGFEVGREPCQYVIDTGHERRIVRWKKSAVNMIEVVMRAVDALADAPRCLDCMCILTDENRQMATRRGVEYARNYCKPCYRKRNAAAVAKVSRNKSSKENAA